MNHLQPNRIPVTAAVLFLVAALLLRAWLNGRLLQSGTDPVVAADLSYLVVPVSLACLLGPLMRARTSLLKSLFARSEVCLSACLYAVLLGALMRLAYWAQLVAGVALGIYREVDAASVTNPVFSFACPPLPLLLLGFFTMSFVTPLVEEFMHRGVIQSSLHHRGATLAITASALIFMAFHRTSAWHFALFAGFILGFLFWTTRTLWLPMLTHATINGLAQLDWRCLAGQWHPPVEALPLWPVAGVALSSLALALSGIGWILRKKIPGSNVLPGIERLTERVRPAR